MNNNAEQLREILKNDEMTRGIKLWEPAIEHLEFLLMNHSHPEYGHINEIRFYMMGFASGIQYMANKRGE